MSADKELGRELGDGRVAWEVKEGKETRVLVVCKDCIKIYYDLGLTTELGSYPFQFIPTYSAISSKFKFSYQSSLGGPVTKFKFKTKGFNRIQTLVSQNITDLMRENNVRDAEEVMGAAVKIKKSTMSKVSKKLQGSVGSSSDGEFMIGERNEDLLPVEEYTSKREDSRGKNKAKSTKRKELEQVVEHGSDFVSLSSESL